MMIVEHLSIDGSVLTIDAEADLTTEATAAGWAVVPSLMQAHPFTVHPAGHSAIVERMVRSEFSGLNVVSTDEFSLKGGQLRVAEVELPTATESTRTLTIGAWEGRMGCLATSVVGSQRDRVVEVFDTLRFSEHRRGLAIDSPIVSQPREPEVIKEIPELGVLSIRPAIASVLDRIPRSRGRPVDHGELFRIRATSNTLAFVAKTALVEIKPPAGVDTRQLLAVAEGLRVEWSLGGAD
jgi:hypothetical protein